MSKPVRSKRKINWANVEGAREKKRRLHLEEDEDGIYQCPLLHCDHDGFLSKRGCRKHVRSRHPWYSYFETKPTKLLRKMNLCMNAASVAVHSFYLPLNSLSTLVGEQFVKWLCGSTGGGKPQKQAQQISNRVLRYLKFCCADDDDELTEDTIDFCLGSPAMLCQFVDAMQDELKLGHSAQLGYLKAMSELMDYRKVSGLSVNVISSFSVTEVYLKRARKTIARKMKIKWARDLDIDNLEAKGSWASLEELGKVIPYHLPRFTSVLDNCKNDPKSVSSTDLTFATRFVATYLFINVKGSRPMTYQHLTLEMLEKAQSNGGFIDQKMFKTALKYSFDSLLLEPADLQLIEQYRQHVRPVLNPKCDYLLVTRNGTQYSKLCDLLSKQVFGAIGKHIHPTRYRQIIETESVDRLDASEQQVITEDQKHSSRVAKLHYQKRRSRDVATKAQACMQKLRGEGYKAVGELQTYLDFDMDEDKNEDGSESDDGYACSTDDDHDDHDDHTDDDDHDCHDCHDVNDDHDEIQPNSMSSVEHLAGNPILAREGEKGGENVQETSAEREGEKASVVCLPSKVDGQVCHLEKEEALCRRPDPTRRRRIMRFTSEEDIFLKRGLEKHGFGNWKCILENPEFTFQRGRTADSINKRALSRCFRQQYST